MTIIFLLKKLCTRFARFGTFDVVKMKCL